MVFDRLEVIGFSAAVSLTREGVDHINKAVDRTKVMAYAIVVGIFRSYVFKVEWEERSYANQPNRTIVVAIGFSIAIGPFGMSGRGYESICEKRMLHKNLIDSTIFQYFVDFTL